MKQVTVQNFLKKQILGSVFGLIFLACFHNQIACQDVPTISADQLSHELELKKSKQADLLVVNVLPHDICSECSIPGSINIPVHRLTRKVVNWPKNRNIVVYCAGQNCKLSKHAYQLLSKDGFSRVRVFQGGLRDWVDQNKPTVGLCRAGYLKG